MRLVTWNCRVGGFRKKAAHMAPLRPDILSVQEVEPFELSQFAEDCRPTYGHRSCAEGFPRRGLGVFSYTQTRINAVDGDPFSGFRCCEANWNGLLFNVVGIWTWGTQSARTSYRQAHDGLVRHADWIRQRPTVMLGDFNANASFNGKNWSQLIALTDAFGMVSAYHYFFNEAPGKEKQPTHFHQGRRDRPFHLDYCFVPSDWASRITSVHVGSFSEWCASSDHVPLVVDLDVNDLVPVTNRRQDFRHRVEVSDI